MLFKFPDFVWESPHCIPQNYGYRYIMMKLRQPKLQIPGIFWQADNNAATHPSRGKEIVHGSLRFADCDWASLA